MHDEFSRIGKALSQSGISDSGPFSAAPSGTHCKVFLSAEHAIRFRDDAPDVLMREAEFLRALSHELMPRVLHAGSAGGFPYMIETRLPGRPLHQIWKGLAKSPKREIVRGAVEFLEYLGAQAGGEVYSVAAGKTYGAFQDLLLDGAEDKLSFLKKDLRAKEPAERIASVLAEAGLSSCFPAGARPVLFHGDLIIHNLLSDGRKLTGVLDWQLAGYGDPDYDLCRLFYYRECARAYREQGTDVTFEADFMDMLVGAVKDAGLIRDENVFMRKYRFVRAAYFLNALDWAARSGDPAANIEELTVQWEKGGIEYV